MMIPIMHMIYQTIAGALGAVGFAILFNVRQVHKLAAVGLGGIVSWVVYLFSFEIYADKALSSLVATLAAGLLAEILARVLKTPVTVLLVPMLIPLIPGGDLYYATLYLVQSDTVRCAYYLELVVWEAAAIAFGIILITSLFQIVAKTQIHGKRRKKEKQA